MLKSEALNLIFKDYVPKAVEQIVETEDGEDGSEDGEPRQKKQRRVFIEPKSRFKKVTNKVKAIRNLRTKIKWNDTIAAILAIAGLVLSSFEYEYYYAGESINISNLNATEFANAMTNDQAGDLIMNR